MCHVRVVWFGLMMDMSLSKVIFCYDHHTAPKCGLVLPLAELYLYFIFLLCEQFYWCSEEYEKKKKLFKKSKLGLLLFSPKHVLCRVLLFYYEVNMDR